MKINSEGKIDSMEYGRELLPEKRNSFKKPDNNDQFLGNEINNTLDIPSQFNRVHQNGNEEFGTIKISKLTTMRSKGSPSGLISQKVQAQTNKRMTIKSPVKMVRNIE